MGQSDFWLRRRDIVSKTSGGFRLQMWSGRCFSACMGSRRDDVATSLPRVSLVASSARSLRVVSCARSPHGSVPEFVARVHHDAWLSSAGAQDRPTAFGLALVLRLLKELFGSAEERGGMGRRRSAREEVPGEVLGRRCLTSIAVRTATRNHTRLAQVLRDARLLRGLRTPACRFESCRVHRPQAPLRPGVRLSCQPRADWTGPAP